ncbi:MULTISPECIES: DUF2934 domain-containing protein [Paracoccus]|uniref:DUF2934 domain-containing protein n=1 Tax=Paracoccus fontiphilus TaxID=1815556 RepID=A0ABV7IC19_9RHOB|nr:DUF2934 domain-containing protein [Paracoccus fontiphilus]
MATEHDDRIRQRAHQLWEEQGRPEGKHAEHWEQARTEIGNDETLMDRLREDPPEARRGTVESELTRRQQDDLNPHQSET